MEAREISLTTLEILVPQSYARDRDISSKMFSCLRSLLNISIPQ